jgi:Cu2+-exporting ATPase
MPPAAVTCSAHTVLVRHQALFGAGCEELCAQFLGRVFGVEGVRAVSLDCAQASAAIAHGTSPRDLPAFLLRLSAAVRDSAPCAACSALPRVRLDRACTIHRYGGLLSTCKILLDRPGRLHLRHPAVSKDRSLAREVERRLAAVPGVFRAGRGAWTSGLFVHYDPSRIGAFRLIRLVEETLDDPGGWAGALPAPAASRFGLPITTLGTAALGEFALPAANPVCAVLLVGTNLGTFKAAWLQLRARQLGLPVLYTAIMATALATGHFLSCALMSVLYRFWHDRLRLELAAERRRLLHGCLPRPRSAVLITPDGTEVLVDLDRLQSGDRVLVRAGETVPADGRVIRGEAIVDERSFFGGDGATRKRMNDPVLAGSSVLTGSVRLEITAPADRTLASSISRALLAATSPTPGATAPSLRAELFADQAVGPTLATAGVGLLIGDITTVAAVLPPDYATGPGMAVPLETLRNAAACARKGIIVHRGDVFERLARVDQIVLQDDPALSRAALEVAAVEAFRLPEAELLRYAASASRHLFDDRASALAAACRARGVHLLDLPPVAFDPGVTVLHLTRRVRVLEPAPSPDGLGSLSVEIDGGAAGVIHFERSSRPESAAALRRIRELGGVHLALVSNRSERDVAALASLLNVDTYQCSFSSEDVARYLRGCRTCGLRTAYVVRGGTSAPAGAEAFVTVSLGGERDLHAGCAAAVILKPRMDLFAELWEAARLHEDRVLDAQKLVLLPNVLCVAGAFLFGFTSLTAVMITNLATFGLYNRAAGSLRALNPAAGERLRRAALYHAS